jgi:Rrf2 family nitric oxide-sensitive transcriptional repressor
MYAAVRNDRLITIEETAEVYDISRAHLMKAVNHLTRAGLLKTARGRTGGHALAKRPDKISLSDVIRAPSRTSRGSPKAEFGLALVLPYDKMYLE